MRFLFPILLIIVAVLVFYFKTMQLLQSVTLARADAATVNQALDKARELLKVRDEKQKELINFPEDVRLKLEKFLPSTVDNVRLIIDLISLGEKYGMTIKNPQVAPSPKSSVGSDLRPYDSVDLTFTTTGSYELFQRFLADLERSLRLTDVTSLTFSSFEKGDYEFSVTVRTYWLK